LEAAVEAAGGYLEAVERLGEVDLMIAPLTAFGARMAREKHGIPLLTVHLQPLAFMSAHDTPVMHRSLAWFCDLPPALKRLLFSLPNPVDLLSLPRIQEICAEHGVPPPGSVRREWWHSPDGVLALFPDWFGMPQPDWPENLMQWDFPMEDLGNEWPMEAGLVRFLEEGERPVVFTPGSAKAQVERFFETALEVVKRLGIRAVFVTRKELRIPEELDGRIQLVEFAPFGALLKHASAFVHHGGVGTMAQGFRAGLPQLVMAMSHDQPDNANRLEKLGAGIGLTPRTFTPDRVERELGKLLSDPSFARAATELKERTEGARDAEQLAGWIEARAGKD
jgi:rhamnosyltransferase subunit B